MEMTIIDRVRMNGFMIVGADDTGLGGRFSLVFFSTWHGIYVSILLCF